MFVRCSIVAHDDESRLTALLPHYREQHQCFPQNELGEHAQIFLCGRTKTSESGLDDLYLHCPKVRSETDL
ncbi:hypothetical protein J6590_101896 [Homalodisca vitripennis]|nr:hypothetical protein J6590_101896 [Homalodisca vitripennis]